MIGPGTRVALAEKPAQTGRVSGSLIDGMAYVRWDGGGGHSVHVVRLTLIQEGTS